MNFPTNPSHGYHHNEGGVDYWFHAFPPPPRWEMHPPHDGGGGIEPPPRGVVDGNITPIFLRREEANSSSGRGWDLAPSGEYGPAELFYTGEQLFISASATHPSTLRTLIRSGSSTTVAGRSSINGRSGSSSPQYNTVYGANNTVGSGGGWPLPQANSILGWSNKLTGSSTNYDCNTVIGNANALENAYAETKSSVVIGDRNFLNQNKISYERCVTIGAGNRQSACNTTTERYVTMYGAVLVGRDNQVITGRGTLDNWLNVQNNTIVGQRNLVGTETGSCAPYSMVVIGSSNSVWSDYRETGSAALYEMVVIGDKNTLPTASVSHYRNVMIGASNTFSSSYAPTIYENTIVGPNNSMGGSSSVYDNIAIGRGNSIAGDRAAYNNYLLGGSNRAQQSQRSQLIGDNNRFDGESSSYNEITVLGRNNALNASSSRYNNSLVLGAGNRCLPPAWQTGDSHAYMTWEQILLMGRDNTLRGYGTNHSREIVIGLNNTLVSSQHSGSMSSNTIIGNDNLIGSSNTPFSQNILITNNLNLAHEHNSFYGNVIVGKVDGGPHRVLENVVAVGNPTFINSSPTWLPTSLWGDIKKSVAIGACTTLYPNAIHIGGNTITNAFWGAGTSQNWTQMSDPRLKEHIVDADVSRCLVDINRLKVSRFSYRKTGSDRYRTGFVSTDFAGVFPKSVTKLPYKLDDEYIDDCEGIDQSQVVPTLVAAVQALSAKVEMLVART